MTVGCRDLFRFYTPEARAGVDSSETVTAHVQYTLLRIRKLVGTHKIRAKLPHSREATRFCT